MFDKTVSEFRSILAITPGSPPVYRMIFHVLAVCAPLILGIFLGNLVPSIVAGLLGHFLFLTNAQTHLMQKLKNAVKNAAFFLTCLALGTLLRDLPWIFLITFCLGVYALGISINISVRSEMVAMLGLVNLIIGFYSTFIDSSSLTQILTYSLFDLIYILLLISLFHWLFERNTPIERPPKPSLRSTMKQFHLYSLSFSLIALIGYLLCRADISERPYWVLITFIVIYKPEMRISLHKMIQRLLGTLVGVALTSLFFHYTDDPNLHIAFVAISSFLLPYTIYKNYWLGTISITSMVLSLLSLPISGGEAEHLALIRLTATIWGVGLALLGVFLYRILNKIYRNQISIIG